MKDIKTYITGSPGEKVVAVFILITLATGAYALFKGDFLSLIASLFYLLPLMVVGVIIASIRTAQQGMARKLAPPETEGGWRKTARIIQILVLAILFAMLIMVVVTNLLPR